MSGFTPLLFTYVFAAVFLAGIVRGATGFGFSMIMIVLLTLFFPPAQVAPVILFWEVLASIGHLPFVYRQVHWKSLRWLALGVALGTPFGVYCLVSIPVDAMRLIINAVVLILTSMLYCGLRPKNAPTPPQTTGVGLLAGIINGASANGGPPIILFSCPARLGPPWGALRSSPFSCSRTSGPRSFTGSRGSSALIPSSLPLSLWFPCSSACGSATAGSPPSTRPASARLSLPCSCSFPSSGL